MTRAARLLLGLTTLIPSAALASLPDLISLGPRSAAMAGTGIAMADDWEATYQNPAGLSSSQKKLSLGFIYGRAWWTGWSSSSGGCCCSATCSATWA